MSDAVETGTSERLLTVRQVAEHLGVSQPLVYKMIATGELPAVCFRRVRRVRPGDLRAFEEQYYGRRGPKSGQPRAMLGSACCTPPGETTD